MSTIDKGIKKYMKIGMHKIVKTLKKFCILKFISLFFELKLESAIAKQRNA